MITAELTVNKLFKRGIIDKRIFGSFLEHMGRTIYTGIYEPTHELADEDGFRKDVLKCVEELGVTAIRYPGGNFVSCYDWKDGIGAKDTRPQKIDIAWRAIETNQFGTDEFMKFIKKTGIEPIMTVNLGTGGVRDAVELVEYCNFPKGTYYSNLRRNNGNDKPYDIKLWCLGNEMDGPWQMGHKTADEYGRLAAETAKAMKRVAPDIKLVSCGSSLSLMETYPEWEAQTLKHTYDYVDYISLHQYYAGQDKGTPYFLAQSTDMDRYINTVSSVCSYIKAMNRSNKDIYISFDEWGVWSQDPTLFEKETAPWQIAPHFSEMIYTHRDALLFASMLLSLIRHSNVVKIACQSLLTNISATIMTEPGGEVWLQPNYYPFSHASKYARGTVLHSILECKTYDSNNFRDVPYLDHVVIYNENQNEIVLMAVNRADESISLNFKIEGLEFIEMIEHIVMESEDLLATNEYNHDNIKPYSTEKGNINNQNSTIEINKFSWNVIRIKVK